MGMSGLPFCSIVSDSLNVPLKGVGLIPQPPDSTGWVVGT